MADHVGAHWIRAALQVNPYGYKGKNEPAQRYTSEDDYNQALLDQCDALGIQMIAITDHWCVDTAAGLIAAAEARGIVALPGFEANTSEGVHLLVIFEVGTPFAEINAAIGMCGGTPGSSGTGSCGYDEVIDKVVERGALVIPAHVNASPSGLLARESGQPLQRMVKHPRVNALGISPDMADARDQASVLANRKPFDRQHPLAVVYADDVMGPGDLAKRGASSWFKVSTERLESLMLAFRTPVTRVSTDDPAATPRAIIRELSWTGGFLDEVTIPLSEELSAFIGGPGTGKSTAIESLRYALGIEPIGASALADHRAIVKDVLKTGTIIKVAVETAKPTPHTYTIERLVNDVPVVRDASGSATNLRPEDIVPRVEIFGQHELAELANDPARVATMLQRFTGSDGPDLEHQRTLALLAENRARLQRKEAAKETLENELADIPRLEEQIKQYDTTDVPGKLAAQQRLELDQAVLKEAADRIGETRTTLADLTDPQLGADLTADYENVDDSPQKELLNRATAATSGLATKLADIATQVRAALDTAEQAVAAAQADWTAAVTEQREEYNTVLRTLHEQGMQPDKYVDTKRALEGLKAKLPRRKKLDQEIAGLKTTRGGLLGKLRDHEKQQTERLHDAIRAANAATDGVVVVQPVPDPDRAEIKQLVVDALTGAKNTITTAIDADTFSTRAFVDAARKGTDGLATYGIKGAQAANLLAAGEPLFREMEELSVGLAVDVKLDVGYGSGTKELKSMGQLSKGQKATALLLLLLSGSDAPLVIDQPEDDLDNRFVFNGIVANLRKLKGQRQVIVSTHNANVPVLGDAELIVTLEGDGQRGRPAADGIGSLDDKKIRAHAENILEGGPDAFNARQHLYGF
ncbi:TrlF family AAA-like ATPase [Aestuariimicrobium sp. Y1814]|uniref:TrlF family AAA-like ATPase n=1 Tax=Aestuariimicrobium sp. Y1814 TaxID=3418742 RepID=UPI003DA6F0B4